MESPAEPRLYTIQPVAGKGLGVIATQNIHQGTRIISESPILTFNMEFKTGAELHEHIMQKIDNLSAEHKAYFYTLHHHGSVASKESEILATNSLPSGVPSAANANDEPKGIYLDACRINHDCRSVGVFTWNENLKQITIHAVKNIRKGQEITINYNHAFQCWENRRQALFEDFGFHCSCDTCSLAPDLRALSDQRLVNIQVLKHYAFNSNDRRHSPIKFFQFLVLLLRLLAEEGLYDRSAHWVHYLAFETSVYHGDLQRAEIFATRAADCRSIFSGEDDPDTVDYRTFANDPKTHELYEQHGKYAEFDAGVPPRCLSETDSDLWLWRYLSLEVATHAPKVACFAAGLRIEALEKFPSDDASKPILDVDNFGIMKQPVAHWCFIGEIASIAKIGLSILTVKDKTGLRFPVQCINSGQRIITAQLQSLQPGWIIAFIYAQRHVFEDGTLGMVVEDASLVKVLTGI